MHPKMGVYTFFYCVFVSYVSVRQTRIASNKKLAGKPNILIHINLHLNFNNFHLFFMIECGEGKYKN